MRVSCFSLAFLLVLSPFTAAQTFVVDASNGPGANFTSIAAAVAAVPSGARLLVRAGVYAAFTITAKTVTLDADPGVEVTCAPSISISALAAGQYVVLRGLALTAPLASPYGALTATNCAGRIVLDDTTVHAGRRITMAFTNCDRVMVRDHRHATSLTDARTDAVVSNSHCVFESCDLGGSGVNQGPFGVDQVGGSVQIVECQINGGHALLAPIAAAIRVQGGDLRVLRHTTLQCIGLSHLSVVFGYGIVSTASVVRVEPNVAFINVVAATSGGTPTVQLMPSVVSSFGGSTVATTLRGVPGDLGGIFAAFPGPRAVLPGIGTDPSWQDIGSVVPVAVGVVPPTGHLLFSLPTGNASNVDLVMQAVTYSSTVGFKVTNPSFVRVP